MTAPANARPCWCGCGREYNSLRDLVCRDCWLLATKEQRTELSKAWSALQGQMTAEHAATYTEVRVRFATAVQIARDHGRLPAYPARQRAAADAHAWASSQERG